MLSTTNIAQRVDELDWSRIYRDLDERGYALTPRILSEEECEELKSGFINESMDEGTTGLRVFRERFYRCFLRRADALFELCNVILTADSIPAPVHLRVASADRRGKLGGWILQLQRIAEYEARPAAKC
jgi:hypothetical protein